ncbi:MAG: permease-like cell division protein FtsX [Pseudomonadota bacterium]
MTVWLRHQQDALVRTLQRFGRTPLATSLSILVIAVTLALPVGLYLALLNLHGIAGRINAEPQISLFLALEATPSDVQAVETRLKMHHAVAQFKFISKEEAFEEMRTATRFGDALEALDKNPLPDAFVIRSKSSDPAVLEALRDDLAMLSKVEHIQLDSAWAKRLADFSNAGEKVVLMLSVALGAALLAVTGNTIRLQILTQREEIEVGRLIGASDDYVRRPYLYFGALQGLLGGVLALALAVVGLLWLSTNLVEIIRVYAPDFRPGVVPWKTGATVIVLPTILGWLGAYASVSMYLRQIRPR